MITACQSKGIVGVTGTRTGLSAFQVAGLQVELESPLPTGEMATVLHHGDCVGADAEAHAIARGLGLHIIGHPPLSPALRAGCACDELRAPEPYMVRNRHIVEDCERLIGLPDSPPRLRSGSWATIRMALRLNKPVLVLFPDGKREEHGWS